MKRSILFSAALLLAVAAPLAAVPGASQAQTTARFVMHAPLRVLDPILTSAYVTRNHGYLVYDTLFSMDATGHPQPQMVASWTVSADGLEYTFKLRPGLTFHDGAPVTAADVVASLQRWEAGDPTIGNRLKSVTAALAAPAADTFTLKLSAPYGLVLESLAKESSPVPFIMPRRIASVPASQAITEVIGSGPYKFVQADFQAGVKATYVKFADYVPRQEPASAFAGGKLAKIDRLQEALDRERADHFGTMDAGLQPERRAVLLALCNQHRGIDGAVGIGAELNMALCDLPFGRFGGANHHLMRALVGYRAAARAAAIREPDVPYMSTLLSHMEQS